VVCGAQCTHSAPLSPGYFRREYSTGGESVAAPWTKLSRHAASCIVQVFDMTRPGFEPSLPVSVAWALSNWPGLLECANQQQFDESSKTFICISKIQNLNCLKTAVKIEQKRILVQQGSSFLRPFWKTFNCCKMLVFPNVLLIHDIFLPTSVKANPLHDVNQTFSNMVLQNTKGKYIFWLVFFSEKIQSQ